MASEQIVEKAHSISDSEMSAYKKSEFKSERLLQEIELENERNHSFEQSLKRIHQAEQK